MKSTALTPLDRPYYSYIKSLFYAFYKTSLYEDVLKRWKGFGLKYLLLMTFVFSLPYAIVTMMNFNQFFENRIVYPISQIPMLAVKSGHVFFGKTMPYIIKDKNNIISVVIDTKSSVNKLKTDYPTAMIVIADKEVFAKPVTGTFFGVGNIGQGDSEGYLQSLGKNDNAVFNGPAFLESMGISKLKLLSLGVIYPLIAMVLFGVYTTLYFVLAFMAQVASNIFFRMSLNYKEAYRMLTVTGTAPALFFSLGLAFNYLPGFLGGVYLVLIAIYFCLAIVSIRYTLRRMVRN